MADDDGWGWDVDEPQGGGTTTSQVVCGECGWPMASCACERPTLSSGFRQPRPPLAWLFTATGLAVGGGLLAAVLGGAVWAAVVGWLLAGPAAVLTYGHFLGRTTVVSSMAGYGEPSWLPLARKAVPMLILVAVAVASWRIADWASRL